MQKTADSFFWLGVRHSKWYNAAMLLFDQAVVCNGFRHLCRNSHSLLIGLLVP